MNAQIFALLLVVLIATRAYCSLGRVTGIEIDDQSITIFRTNAQELKTLLISAYPDLAKASEEERQDFSLKEGVLYFHSLKKRIKLHEMLRGRFILHEYEDCYWYRWNDYDVHKVRQLADQWGEDFLSHRCWKSRQDLFVHIAASASTDISVIRELIGMGFTLDQVNGKGQTAIDVAEAEGNFAILPDLYQIAGRAHEWEEKMEQRISWEAAKEEGHVLGYYFNFPIALTNPSLQRITGEYQGPEGTFQINVIDHLIKFGAGMYIGPLRLGLSMHAPFYAEANSSLPQDTQFSQNQPPVYLSNSRYTFDIAYEHINTSRVTPFAGMTFGKRTTAIRRYPIENIVFNQNTLLENSQNLREPFYGLNIALGTHPTPKRSWHKSELELGIRHSGVEEELWGTDRSFRYNSSDLAITLGLRLSSKRRWIWW